MLGLIASANAAVRNPQRDSAAISTLQSAIAALGGVNTVGAIQDCILTGSILNGDGTNSSFNWTIAGSEFLIQTTPAKGGTNTFLSGHGSPAWVVNNSVTSLNSYMARANLPFYLPAYALYEELNNPVLTLQYVGLVRLNGAQAIQIHISDDSDAVGTLVTAQEWFFDPVSFLPVQVQFREPSNESPSDYQTATLGMSQFVPYNGVLVPSAIFFTDSVSSENITISAVTINSGVAQGIFDPPQGGGQ
jgi:hypothetical protein